ncbi:MAG TPA: hypothetical protein VGM23_09615, partial [Armatimonadota bacterium]
TSGGGIGVIGETMLRKWAMNFRLIRSSVWVYALIVLITGMTILLYRPVGVVKRILRKHPLLNAGLLGVTVCMIVGLFTNDSGVAMAATAVLYLVVPLMLLVKEEMTVELPYCQNETAETSSPAPRD